MSELEVLREQINQIDKQIVSLLAERFEIVEQVWEFKARNQLSVYQADQWIRVLKKAKERGAHKKLPSGFIEPIWKAIHKHALFLQYKKKGMYISMKIKKER